MHEGEIATILWREEPGDKVLTYSCNTVFMQ